MSPDRPKSEVLSFDTTAELLSFTEAPGRNTTARVRFTPRPDYKGLLYEMVMIKTDSGDMDLALVARGVP